MEDVPVGLTGITLNTGLRNALVLSGGGARGAYQAGFLAGLMEKGLLPEHPFDIFVGSSAGSINAGMLAAYADEFAAGVERLTEIWSTIEAHQVFRTDVRSLGKIGMRWAWDLSFGGAMRKVQPKSLLDTTPLRELLGRLPLDRLDANIDSGGHLSEGKPCAIGPERIGG